MAVNLDNRNVLLERAREVLAVQDRTSALASTVPDPADASPPRVALIGPYSAGKSLLIAALLDMSHEEAEVISAATPHTRQITAYPWRSYELLDLPGTLSGLDDHEQVARQGVRSSDALVVVTTVELPGDHEAAAIRQLLDQDGFRGRSVLAVNKAASENSDRDVISTELERRVGDMDAVRTVFTDARDFLDSINEPGLTDDDRSLLRSDSGIGDLETAVEALFSQPIPPRQLAQLHEAARVLEDGLAVWKPTDEEEVIEVTAASAQAALDAARKDSAEAVERALATLGDCIRAIGMQVAARVDPETGAIAVSDAQAASAEVDEVSARFVDSVNRGVAHAAKCLARELDSALKQQKFLARNLDGRRARLPTERVQAGKPDQIVEALRKAISEAGMKRLDRLIEGGTRPGSRLHGAGRRANWLLGKKPKPYAHIETAETLSKALRGAKGAVDLLGPIVDIGSVIDSAMLSKRIRQRRDGVRKRYGDLAEDVVAEERARVEAHVQAQFAPYLDNARPQIEEAAALCSARDAACSQLRAARDAIIKALGRA